MHAKPALFSLTASLVISLVSPAILAAPADGRLDRGAVVADLMKSWQQRILSEQLPVEDAKNWALRNAAKFSRLTDEQLQMAQRATSVGEIELLFVTAPIADGTSLEALSANLPGNVAVVPPKGAAGAAQTKSNPAGSPTLYADLVFTAVTPCRVYDSRFSTANPNGTPPPGAMWAANNTYTIDLGPNSSYAFEGGQATGCLGTQVGGGQVAAVMTAVSTVNQTGAGYLVFFSDGGANPNPYGVAQWFQPGYVQTSFVVMPTDLISNVFSDGFIGNAGSHVIVDVIGYFAKPKAVALDCTTTTASSTAAVATDSFLSFPVCTAGYSRVGGYCNGPFANTNGYLIETGASGCSYRNLSASATYSFGAVSQCCRTAGR